MARHADTRRELGANVVTIAGQSMPEFWSGLMLVTIFAVLIPILPAAGFTTWCGLILPTVTIADPADRADLPDGAAGDGRGLRCPRT